MLASNADNLPVYYMLSTYEKGAAEKIRCPFFYSSFS